MGKIIIIPNSDFSRNLIEKVDIIKQEKTVDVQTPTSYSSSTESIIKNNNQ